MFALPFDCSGVPAGDDAFTEVVLHSRWCGVDGPVVVVVVEYDRAPGVEIFGAGFVAGVDPDAFAGVLASPSDNWGEGSRLFERARVTVSLGREARRNTTSEIAGEVRGMLHGACVVEHARYYPADVRGGVAA